MGQLKSRVVAAAVAAAVAGAALPARVAIAQETDAPDDADGRARQIYLQGDEAYAAGDYERAAALFKEAYELSGRSALLFNLGNAYERMGAYGRAADALRRYVESPSAQDRVVVNKRIERLEEAHRRRQEEIERLRDASSGEEEPERVGGAAPPGDVEVSGGSGSGGDARAYWWLGGGGAALASGLIFGFVSRSAGNQAASQCSEEGGEALCPDSARSALLRERGFAIAADASAVLGLAAAGFGGYLLWDQRRGDRDRGIAVGPAVLPEALGVGVSGEF